MMPPNVDILNELFTSDLWKELKIEICQCRDNSLLRLKREGEINRDFQAGMVTAYETILGLEAKYKNIDIKGLKNDGTTN